MNITRLEIALDHYEVGLSGAVPDRRDWSEPAMDRAVLEFVALLSGLVFKYGGRIVHGSHPTFTPVILHQARMHAGPRFRKPVTLVMSELWAQDLERDDVRSLTDVAELLVTRVVGSGRQQDPETRNQSLSAMRRVLVDSMNVMVAVGGKMHTDDGMVPGLGEEMELAGRKGVPRFLVAGLGGYAGKLGAQLEPQSLGNGLSEDENARLLTTDDVGASVSILFEHLARSQELLKSAQQPVKWNSGLGVILDHRDGSIDEEATGFILRVA